MSFRIDFLGTGGTMPTHKRALAAYLVTRGGDKWLVDAGEGTQRQLWGATGGMPDLDAVLLTHYHGDHTMGLPGIINTLALYGRTRPLSVYGPGNVRDNCNALIALMTKDARKLIRWIGIGYNALGYRHVAPPSGMDQALVARCDEYDVRAYTVQHAGGRAVGYVFEEHTKPGKIDAMMCEAAGLTGPEIGRVKRGETVKGVRPEDVVGPERSGRKVVFTGDTAPCDSTVKAAQGADLLVHDATFLSGQNMDKDHSTAAEAARIGSWARVRRLALAHISARNNIKAVQAEAEALYPGVWVPRDLDFIVL